MITSNGDLFISSISVTYMNPYDGRVDVYVVYEGDTDFSLVRTIVTNSSDNFYQFGLCMDNANGAVVITGHQQVYVEEECSENPPCRLCDLGTFSDGLGECLSSWCDSSGGCGNGTCVGVNLCSCNPGWSGVTCDLSMLDII